MTPGPAPFTVFLDRDGVFNENPETALWRWPGCLPGVAEAFARLNRPGIQTSLATNQPYVGLGLLPPPTLGRLHARMIRELELVGGRLDHVEYAGVPIPFPSRRRKPGPGMLEAGARFFAKRGTPVDKRRAVMVGDKSKDAAAGAAFGIPAILLATTHSKEELEARCRKRGVAPLAIVPTLDGAVDLVLKRFANA
jgi:D-glycero-D-manno-heptose 1,7-bisphosphate phosphatase